MGEHEHLAGLPDAEPAPLRWGYGPGGESEAGPVLLRLPGQVDQAVGRGDLREHAAADARARGLADLALPLPERGAALLRLQGLRCEGLGLRPPLPGPLARAPRADLRTPYHERLSV